MDLQECCQIKNKAEGAYFETLFKACKKTAGINYVE
jgi:hypothetical protein